MVLIGLLLVLLAIAAGVWLVLGTLSLTTPVDLDTAGVQISATPLALLIAGAAVLFVLWLGLAAIRGGVKRGRRPAREAKEAQRQAEFEENIRADERSRAEETHQSAMAERDRVREDEFSAKSAERDRIRDADERARLAEHEQRVRSDERARVEREYSQRADNAAGAAGTGTAAGAGARTGEQSGANGAVDEVHDQRSERDGDAVGERSADVEPAAWDGTSRDAGSTGPADTASGAHAGGDATERHDATERLETTERHDATERLETTERHDDDEEGGDRYRTVADKIMGRAPTGRD